MTEREVSSERVSGERLESFIKRCDDMSEDGQFSWWTELASILRDYAALRSSVKTEDADEDVFAALAEEELLSAIEAPAAEVEVTFDEAAAAAWDFVRPGLLERGREKGYAGVWADGFRQGWDAASRAPSEVTELRAAAEDALSGWRYIRQVHGDLYGVGWDRVENALTAALKGGK